MFILLLLVINNAYTQPLAKKLAIAVQQLEADSQMRHAIIGLSVYNSKTGRPVYEHNAQVGLAPASTQKLFTSCAAFDLLGKQYQYKTEIGYDDVNAGKKRGYFIIRSSADPSFGSYRFVSTRPDTILERIAEGILRKNLHSPFVAFRVFDSLHSYNKLPGGWIWEDIGNYYGAAAHGLNWMENQFDIVFRSNGRIGGETFITETKPSGIAVDLRNKVTAAEKGSGDNTIVYLSYGRLPAVVEGTIPINENAFKVSASIADPSGAFLLQLEDRLKRSDINGIVINEQQLNDFDAIGDSIVSYKELYTHFSPPFDTLNYWFLKKSINLYGEAFIKTMAQKKWGTGSTEKGVELLKDFWNRHGIEKSALHICDGSGLSPQNRVTAAALVNALQYAKTRPWFSSFYYALPEYNGMKMKSGSIAGARAYAGYHVSGDGNEYSFAIIINNYDGPSSAVVKKMYKLLDNLK